MNEPQAPVEKGADPTGWTPWSHSRLAKRRDESRRAAYEPIVLAAAAVMVGVAADRYSSLGDAAAPLAVVALAAWWHSHRLQHSCTAAVLLLLAAALAGGGWHHQHWRLFASNDLGRYAPRRLAPACVEAVVHSSPETRATDPPSPFRAIPRTESTRLLIDARRLRDGSEWTPVRGRLELVVDGHLAGVTPGDRLIVFGQLTRLAPATNPGQFDSALHHRGDRRLCRLRAESPDCVSVVRRCEWPLATHGIEGLRDAVVGVLDRHLSERSAGLMSAMLLGERGRLTTATADLFRRTGSLHVLVVSGLHVGLVVASLYFATRMGWLPRRAAIVAMMLLAVGYAVLAGGRPPVLRAMILTEVGCVAALLGRRVIAFNSLAVAAVIVLLLNPSELFRSGTQLSFLATATLIWFGGREMDRRLDPLDYLIATTRPWWQQAAAAGMRWGRLLVLASLAVWLVSAPLLLHRFHLASPIAVPLSLFVFPLVAVAVTSGLGLMLVGGLAPPLASPIAGVCELSVTTLHELLAAADSVPGASFWSPSPAWWWTLGFYGLLAAALATRRHAAPQLIVARLGLLWAPVAFAPWLASLGERPELRATFIDVGHGASVLIEAPGGGTLLYDAGSLGSPDAAAERIAGVLWSRGHRRIDAVVLSHADVDHFNALPGLLDRFHVGGVYTHTLMLPPAPVDPADRSARAALRRLLDERGVPLHSLAMGDRLTVGPQLTAQVLHPMRRGVVGSDNANSLVLAIESLGKRLLLPGDLEQEGLEMLLHQEPYDCDLLLAPHHGSSRSDPPGFANWSQPEWVVISGGASSRDAGASYGAAGARVMRTSQGGAIAVTAWASAGLEVMLPTRPSVPCFTLQTPRKAPKDGLFGR